MPDLPFETDLIIPPVKVLRQRLFTDDEGAIGVLVEDDRHTLELACGPWRYQLKCTEGRYPDYRQVVPAESGQWAGRLIIAEEDLPVVKAAISRFVTEERESVLIYGDAERVVLLSALDLNSGARSHAELQHSLCETDDRIVRRVNGNFLLEALDAGFTEIRVCADVSPWRCTGSADGLHVLMPMHMEAAEVQVAADYVAEHCSGQQQEEKAMTTTDATDDSHSTQATAPAADKCAKKTQSSKAKRGTRGPQFKVVETYPMQELLDGITEAQELAQKANQAVRGLKAKARALERHYKAREREFESTGRLIAKLQEAAGF